MEEATAWAKATILENTISMVEKTMDELAEKVAMGAIDEYTYTEIINEIVEKAVEKLVNSGVISSQDAEKLKSELLNEAEETLAAAIGEVGDVGIATE